VTINTTIDSLSALAHYIKTEGSPRVIGLVGAPGSGKSTTSEALLAYFDDAVVVPMDGFHYSNDVLEEMGLRHLKGAPETFDSEAFVDAIREVCRRQKTVSFPEFDRAIESSRPNRILVTPEHQVVIVEGNYLLLPSHPWSELLELIDLMVYVERKDSLRIAQLKERHINSGKDPDFAAEWMSRVDGPNAALIEQTRPRADIIFYNLGS